MIYSDENCETSLGTNSIFTSSVFHEFQGGNALLPFHRGADVEARHIYAIVETSGSLLTLQNETFRRDKMSKHGYSYP